MIPSEQTVSTRLGHYSSFVSICLIILSTVIAYYPALFNEYIWDDDAYLTKNKLVQSRDGLARIWFEPRASPQYYPLVFSTFWVEHALWGLRPLGYHLVNILLHAASAVILWRLLLKLAAPGAWIIAMVFALHPLHVESVAWVTERKNVLSGVFYLTAMWTYLRYALSHTHSTASFIPPRRDYYFSLLLFVCALLSKSVTASLPAAILLVVYWKRGRLQLTDVARLIPFFVIGLLAASHTAWLEKDHVGADRVAWGLSALEKFLLAGRILCFYFVKLLWPAELIFFYPRWPVDAMNPRHYLYSIIVMVFLWSLWRYRERLGRGPLVAALYFCGTLFPVLGFFKVYPMLFSYVADHFAYLASIGAMALVIGLIARVTSDNGWYGFARRVAVLVLLIACATRTWIRCAAYADEETLWRDTIRQNRFAWAAYNNLGAVMYDRKRLDEAFEFYQKAVELNPTFALGLDNYGTMLLQRGRSDEALAAFRRAVDSDPFYPSTQRNLGALLCDRGEFDEGIRHLTAAILLAPDSWEAHEELGNGLFKAGRIDEAIRSYNKVLALKPGYPLGLCNLGVALASKQLVNEAMAALTEAIKIDPKHVPSIAATASILADLGRTPEAVAHYRRALEIQPDHAPSHQGLAVALALQGKQEEAVEHFREAVRLEPEDVNYRFNLARALEELGRTFEALQEYKELLRIHPADEDARARVESLQRPVGATP